MLLFTETSEYLYSGLDKKFNYLKNQLITFGYHNSMHSFDIAK